MHLPNFNSAFQSLYEKLRQYSLLEPPSDFLSDNGSILAAGSSLLELVIPILNQILASKILTDQERLTLRDLLSLSVSFVFLLLPMFFKWAVVPPSFSNRHVCAIYSTFCAAARKDLESNRAFVEELKVIQARKGRSRQYRKQLRSNGIFQNQRIHVHRFHERSSINIFKKKIVVDCCDEERFPSDSHYHVSSSSIYVIEPKANVPEIHLLVLDNPSTFAPKTDDEVRKEFIDDQLEYTPSSWYIGAVVYGAFQPKVGSIEDGLDKVTDFICCNIKERTPVERGKTKLADGIMLGGGPRQERGNGTDREWSNIKTENRFEIYSQNDEAVGFFIMVCHLYGLHETDEI